MDFPALPRRDLQALCKRNGVRANMTNAAMADALRALPKVDGIEEYIKQAAVEEQNTRKRLGSPLPRGRRAVAKSSEPIEPEEGNEEEKGNSKRQSSREDEQAAGVGRRGASRRARLVPIVPQLAAMAEEGAQREMDLMREAKRDNAPALGRRGACRRARPSLAVAMAAAESEVAGAEEEQKEVEVDDGSALRVGRRARPAPSVAALEAKVVAEEEQRAPIPRGRRVNGKGTSTEPIRLDDSDGDEKENAKPEEQQEDVQILGVGRRGGASRRAQAAPEAKAEEEQRAPIPRSHRVKANSSKLIRPDDNKEDRKPEEEMVDAPAIAVGRRGASRRGFAPSEAPATAAESKAEAGDVAVEAVPVRATRQRKPTMKAAAAAAATEKKAPQRDTRRDAVMSTLLQQEVQEEPQEAVGAPDMAVEAVPIRATRHRKPTMKAAAAAAATAEEKAPPRAARMVAVMRTLLQQEVQEEPQEAVGALVSYQRCDALEELAVVSDPQKEELNEVDAPKQDEDQDVVVIEDEKLSEEIPAEEPSVTDQECMDNSEMQEQQVDDEKSRALLATKEESPILGLVSMVIEQASDDDAGASFQDDGGFSLGLLDKGVCGETYDAGEEMGFVPGVQTLQAPLTGNKSDASDANHESEIGNFNEVPTVREEISEVDAQEHTGISELQVDIVDEADFLDCLSNMSQDAEEINEKVNIVGEETSEEVNTEDGLGCQEEGDVVVDKVLHGSVDNAILLDCSSDISWVDMEKAGNITSEMPENPAALDEDGVKPIEVVIGDSMSQVTVTDEVVQEEKGVLITDEMLQGTAGMHDDVEDDHFQTVFVQVDQVVTADNPLEQVTDCEIIVETTSLTVDEKQQSTVAIDEDVVKDHFETDSGHADEQIEVVTTDTVLELTWTNVEDVEEKTPPVVDEKQKSTFTMDKDVVNDHFKTDVVHAGELMEVATIDEVLELTKTYDEDVEEIKMPLIVDEKQQSTITMNEDIVDNPFKTHVAHADEQKEVVATEVPEVTGTDSEIEEKAPLIVDEKNQSPVTMVGDVVFDHFRTDTSHADEQKEVTVIVTEVPDEVVEEKALVFTEDLSNQGTVASIKEDHFGTDFGHGNVQKEAITADIETEVSRTQDGGAQKENAFTGDLPQEHDIAVESNDPFTPVLLDDVTESQSKGIITVQPSVSIAEGTSMFKNSSENTTEPMSVLEEKGVEVTKKSVDLSMLSLGQLRAKLKEGTSMFNSSENTTEPMAVLEEKGVEVTKKSVDLSTLSLGQLRAKLKEGTSMFKNSSENTTEPMTVLEEKGVEVAKKSVDLSTLSLGQLRAKLKEKLNAKKNKDAKRVALAKVDENVCRSHAKGQQQNLNLQQH